MIKETLDEREFELINILGADLGANQRQISRHMNLSLGMINMLIRRLISKGYIRIEQLNKRKVQYILTPKGFAEKMRKSVKYTLKTISSIGLIKSRIQEILLGLYEDGARDFYFYGNPDIRILVEIVFRDMFSGNCSFHVLKDPPAAEVNGVLLVCEENIDPHVFRWVNQVDLVKELAKENQYAAGTAG
jgi:DNA-binding MarR family transcriptional regulator